MVSVGFRMPDQGMMSRSSFLCEVPPALFRPADMMDKPVTIRDVAEAAGVSVGTVSRTLNAPATGRGR